MELCTMNYLLLNRVIKLLFICLTICLALQASSSTLDRSFSKRVLNLKKINREEQDDFLLTYVQENQSLLMNPLSFEGNRFYEWIPDGSLNSAVPAECLPL